MHELFCFLYILEATVPICKCDHPGGRYERSPLSIRTDMSHVPQKDKRDTMFYGMTMQSIRVCVKYFGYTLHTGFICCFNETVAKFIVGH